MRAEHNAPRLNPSHGQALAFTLIELLVVISIISLMMAILLPALGRSRETARRAVCASNLHEIALSYTAYASENAEVYPIWFRLNGIAVPYALQDTTAHALTLNGLPDDVNGVWHCPSANPPRGYQPDLINFPGLGVVYFNMDNYVLQTHMLGESGYSGTLSPSKTADPIGPLAGDMTVWWPASDVTGNHGQDVGGTGNPEGYNQAFSDAHVTWYSSAAFLPGYPYGTNTWIFDPDGAGAWPYYYWIEK